MSIIMFTNLKGGVAKTTNAVAIAECLATMGYRTLMIDADHQCTAGELLLGNSEMLKADNRAKTLHDLLKEMLDPEFNVRQLPTFVSDNKVSNIGGGLENLSIIPCSIRIDDFQTNYAKGKRGFKTNEEFMKMFGQNRRKLRTWLTQSFDHTIIDCPPSMALQVKKLLSVADGFITPCQPNKLSIRGAIWLQDRIRRTGLKREAIGTLWSMVRGNDRKHDEVIRKATSQRGGYAGLPRPFKAQIPLTASISHATEESENQQPASFAGKYGTRFAKIYKALAKELIDRLDKRRKGTT